MENREQEIRQDREDLIEGRNAVAEAILMYEVVRQRRDS